jgi:hypothetical protein
MVFCIDGLSAAAHRGCWTLFHETPTVQAFAAPDPLGAAAADPAAVAAADGAEEAPPPELAAGLPPLLLHAVAITATAPTSSPSRRFIL